MNLITRLSCEDENALANYYTRQRRATDSTIGCTDRSSAGVDDVGALFVALGALGCAVDREESTRLATRADALSTVPVVTTRHALIVFATPAAVRRTLGRADEAIARCRQHNTSYTHDVALRTTHAHSVRPEQIIYLYIYLIAT